MDVSGLVSGQGKKLQPSKGFRKTSWPPLHLRKSSSHPVAVSVDSTSEGSGIGSGHGKNGCTRCRFGKDWSGLLLAICHIGLEESILNA